MTAEARAHVQLGPQKLEVRAFPLPAIGGEDALLRIERCGICGSDVEQLAGDLTWLQYPVIPGHEPVGIIEEIGETAARRWGVEKGDRVIVEDVVPCRYCVYCRSGDFYSCPSRFHIGYTSIGKTPSLYGGYADYLYLHPNVTLHKIDRHMPLDLAVLYNPLACGIDWALEVGGAKFGDVVVVLGAGQRGIACGIAAKWAGASTVIMTGLTQDQHKFEVARKLGVDQTIDVEREDVRERVAELTGGRMADVVIDAVPNAASTVTDAVDLARPRGTVAVAGIKGDVPVPGLLTDKIVRKGVTIRGAHGKLSSSYAQAIQILEAGTFPLHELRSRTYPLSAVRDAIDVLAGRKPGENVICVSLDPSA